MSSVTANLAKYCAGITFESLPSEVPVRVGQLLLDLAGIAIRARHDTESARVFFDMIASLGMDHGGATVFGAGPGYSPPAAALLNGALAHSLDFDDTQAAGSLHPSAPVVPAALAACEMSGADGRALVAGIVAGYETCCRVSYALVPQNHYDRGFHPTATAGTFGAAAAAGRVLGLSAQQMESAFGICGSQAAGSLRFLIDGSWNKRLQVGAAAMHGVMAATAANHGFVGGTDALEGQYGFLRGYAPDPVPARVVEGLGARFETLEIAVKPYPACRFTHAPLDGLIALRNEYAIRAEEVEEVVIGLPDKGVDLVGAIAPHKIHPKSVVDGQFSMVFTAAVGLREGSFEWDHYAKHLADVRTRELCDRIRTVVDPWAQQRYPSAFAATVAIHTRRGTFKRKVPLPKGEPATFLTIGELLAKFESLVGPFLYRTVREDLADRLLRPERIGNVSEVLALSAKGGE
ncbi:MAG: MmgE/PrpD family protein [Anaerolineae bacterium]|nr:MmgE/PrpD family protein [Anaerolineae bacterium]